MRSRCDDASKDYMDNTNLLHRFLFEPRNFCTATPTAETKEEEASELELFDAEM